MAQESRKMDKDETGCQPPEGPLLCVNNCGFFGSATTMNLCSKCYRELVLKQTKAAKVAASAATVQSEQHGDASEKQPQQEVVISVVGRSGDGTVSADVSDENDPSQQPPRQPPNRCFTCKKRVGLTGFKCRCGDTFCALHRYSDKHDCPFDYRTVAREAIAKANPVVKADKIDKI